MESSIAAFLMRWLACEHPPTTHSAQIAPWRGHVEAIRPDNGAARECEREARYRSWARVNKMMNLDRGNADDKSQAQCLVYLLGLLAMIKCSICSYQCDN